MAAEPVRRRGMSTRSWIARLRDALDGLVRSSRSRFAILVFAGLVLLFTLLFSLPISRAGEGSGTPLYDALFTAVSVICVTGLGRFGAATAGELDRQGREVLAVDDDEKFAALE